MLKEYAKHYETGEVSPTELVDRLTECGKYGQGFATTEYLAASLLDMDFHTLKQIPEGFNVVDFEQQTLGKRGLLKQIPPRYRTTYFNHTMGGGYTAGYYSYIWAEVLDKDAFELFMQEGIFDSETAMSFRKNILEMGGSDEPMDLYRRFRGADPDSGALLRGRGL